jgi:hypothetical protein
LDEDFDLTYTRLLNAYRGFINGWFFEQFYAGPPQSGAAKPKPGLLRKLGLQ